MDEDLRKFYELERIAYHEAGHTVVAHALQLEILAVSIEPHVTEGGTERRGYCACDGSQVEENNGTVHAAGGVAVNLHFGIGEPIDEDALKVIGIAYSQFGDDPRRVGIFIDVMHQRARCILEQRWSAVQAVANALLGGVTLDGGEAKEIVVSALSSQ